MESWCFFPPRLKMTCAHTQAHTACWSCLSVPFSVCPQHTDVIRLPLMCLNGCVDVPAIIFRVHMRRSAGAFRERLLWVCARSAHSFWGWGGVIQLFRGGCVCICKHFLQLCAHFKASHRVWSLSCTKAEFSLVISDT